MAVKKKKATQKTKKAVAKKHTFHKAVDKKAEDVAVTPPDMESVGGSVVIPSGVMQDIPKVESQSEPELSKVEPSAPVSQPPLQPTPQAANTLVSQPESAGNIVPSVEPISTKDPLAVNDVVKDKPEQEQIDRPKKKNLWIIIAIIIVVVSIGGVLWYFRESAMKQISTKVEITPTPAPSRISPTPAASDSAKLIVDYSKYKIKVLNGSGIGGAAAKGKEILENGKFIVEEIGNAQSSDFDLTIIQAKKGVDKAFLDNLKSVLGETYLLGSGEKLEDSETVDVVIIIGSGKKQL